ncbi:MAG: O-antigen ligase family protein [Acidobacteriota bacterium]
MASRRRFSASSGEFCGRAGRWGLLALLFLAPLPFGSVVGPAWAFLAAGFGLLLAVAAVSFLTESRPFPRHCLWVVFAAALLSIPALLQLIPLPPFLVKLLSPAAADLYAAGGELPLVWMPLSVDRSATLAGLLWIGTCGAAAFLTVALFDRRSIRPLLGGLLILGTGEALYGLMEFLSGQNRIFFYHKIYYTESVTGTYINRNHFAGLMVMLLPVGLGWLLARGGAMRPARDAGWRARCLALGDPEVSKNLLLALVAAVMAAGLALSFSRAGVALGAMALGAVFLLWYRFTRSRRSGGAWRGLIWAGLILVLAVLPLTIRGGGRLATASTDLPSELGSPAGRPVVWAATAGIFRDHPVLGTGLGTFQQVFTRYRPPGTGGIYQHAHEDYLEWLAETGIMGALCGAGFFAGLCFVVYRALAGRWTEPDLGLKLGLVVGLACLALHGLVDFNGHLPANTLIASVLAASLLVLGREDLSRSTT